ncbi:MAG: beta-galactosidase, partial [Tannerellaceae bacterium]|nr:beta-galactosidase [Tannerellaceae bacterium]
DNDYGNGAPLRQQVWKTASQQFQTEEASCRLDAFGNAVFRIPYRLPAGNMYVLTCTLRPSGVVHLAVRYDAAAEGTPTLPRIGLRFRLPETLNEVEYFGRGPEENYPDRCAGTPIGLYHTTAEQLYFPYVRPQENGHHSDTRRLRLSAAESRLSLIILSDTLFGFNALRNAIEDFDSEEAVHRPYQWNNFSPQEIAEHDEAAARNVLRRQTHIDDVSPRPFVEVCLDHHHQGLGGNDSWGALPEPPYRISAMEAYNFSFTLIPDI